MKTYTGKIGKPSKTKKQVIVVGTNTQGRHGKGAALHAIKYWGAIYGQAVGRQGDTYGIVTKDLTKQVHPSIPRYVILNQLNDLYSYAENHSDTDFLVAYSGTGPNLNGYSSEWMAKMFSMAGPIPENLVFEEEFAKLIQSFL